jgi:hypothetical protein
MKLWRPHNARLRFGLRALLFVVTVVALILGYRAAKSRRIDEIMRRHEAVSRSLREMQSRSPVGAYSVSQHHYCYCLPNDEPFLSRWKESIGKSGRVDVVEEVTVHLNATESAKSASGDELLDTILDFYSADIAKNNFIPHSHGTYSRGMWDLWFNESRDIVVRIDVSEIPDEFARKFYSVRLQLIDLQKVGYW